MSSVELNGKKMRSIQSLHWELKKKLDLPDYYGENLDALWDCLTGWIDVPTYISWTNASIVEESIPKYYKTILDILKEAEAEGLIKLSISK